MILYITSGFTYTAENEYFAAGELCNEPFYKFFIGFLHISRFRLIIRVMSVAKNKVCDHYQC